MDKIILVMLDWIHESTHLVHAVRLYLGGSARLHKISPDVFSYEGIIFKTRCCLQS